MKPSYLILLCLTAISLHALPVQWQAFFYQAEEEKLPFTPALKANQLQLPGGKTIKPAPLKSTDNFFDFDKLAPGKNHAVLTASFNCDKARETFLGVGGKAFAIELNGKMVYDFRRKGLGNDFDPVSTKDHIIPVTFKAGTNDLVIRSCRTNWLLDFCYGADRQIKWHFTIAELRQYRPVTAELLCDELLLRPTENSMALSFITKYPVHAGVDFREAGSSNWQRQWDMVGDAVIRNDKNHHLIRLENLKPDTAYEYRLVLLTPPVGRNQRSLWTHRIHKEVFTPVKKFRTPGADNLNFFVLGDTQLSLSTSCKTVAQRDALMAKMRNTPEFKKADFICHIGDLTSYFHSIEKNLFKDFFAKFTSAKDAKPWVYVRGNHELNGIDAVRWHDFFVMPDEKPYYHFKVKNTLFIVLACGDFSPKIRYNSSSGVLFCSSQLVARQKKWAAELVKSDIFKNAKFRIVLSHTSPQLENSQIIDEIRKIAAPLMNGSIHLWISGHCHRYWRMFKNSDILYARQPWQRKPHYTVAKFNWVTLDGPKSNNSFPDFSYLSVNISDKGIKATAIDENGKLMDSFTIDHCGDAVEVQRAAEIKPFKLKK